MEVRVAAEGSHSAGRSPALFGSENLSTVSLRHSGCLPAKPCPPERRLRRRQGRTLLHHRRKNMALTFRHSRVAQPGFRTASVHVVREDEKLFQAISV